MNKTHNTKNKLTEAFADKKALVPYLMAGNPDLPTTAQLILAAQAGGADIIALGVPFSDPVADSPVMEAAGMRALAAGTKLDGIFAMLDGISGQLRIPLVFMTYINPVFVYGYDRFCAQCAAVGVAGIIVPDLPYEEQGEMQQAAASHGVTVITAMVPSAPERLALLARQAQGFVYLMPAAGALNTAAMAATAVEIRRISALPVLIALDAETPEQAAAYAALGDGVVMGGAAAHIIARHGAQAQEPLRDLTAGMKTAMNP